MFFSCWHSLLIFSICYSGLVVLLSRISTRDPGSVFFDPTAAYTPRYSTQRSRQADAFIKSAWRRSNTAQHHNSSALRDTAPLLCVGITTTTSTTTPERARSLRTTIGSLLQGLSQKERDRLELKVLVAHVDPLLHPAVHEPWLRNTVDEVVFYNDTLSPQEIEDLWKLENNPEEDDEILMQEKALLDFSYLFKKCLGSGSDYIAMLGDDVIAVDGWLHRSLAALEEAEERSEGSDENWADYLYLRLFYTEESLGWKPEHRAGHVFWSMYTVSLIAGALWTIRIWKPRSTMGRNISLCSGFWICCVATPLLLLLYFSGGRLTTHPLPRGIVEMNEHGDISHGLIFPRHQAERFLGWFQQQAPVGVVDALAEEWALASDQVRWTIVPSVLQRGGRKVSAGDVNVAETAWNIEFEAYDVAQLEKEHRLHRYMYL